MSVTIFLGILLGHIILKTQLLTTKQEIEMTCTDTKDLNQLFAEAMDGMPVITVKYGY